MWSLIPINYNSFNSLIGGLFFFCCTAFSVYTLIGRGWASNSNYSIIGTIRNVAQTISYEVRIALIFLRIIFFIRTYNLRLLRISQYYIWLVYFYFPLFLCWVVSILAETNRTPFDFAEGESELVSGFNVEYRRGGFTLLFLSEYARIIFIRFLVVILFLGGFNVNFLTSLYLGCFFTFFFI
jgi:NADH-ubiquinone oxidoreductase chain 1